MNFGLPSPSSELNRWGQQLPARYHDDDREVRALTGESALLVLPSQGWSQVRGKDAASFLQGLLTANIRTLQTGAATESWALDSSGKIITLLLVYRDEQGYLLQNPAHETEPLRSHLNKYLIMEDATIEAVHFPIAVSIQGPKASDMVARIQLDENEKIIPHDRTGKGGYDLLLQTPKAIQSLREHNITTVGYEALDLVTAEAFLPRYGIEMTPGTNPLVYGHGGNRISHTKGCFIGQETVARTRDRGHPAQLLVQLEGQGTLPEEPTLQLDGTRVGRLLSTQERPSATTLAYGQMKYAHATVGTALLDEYGNQWHITRVSNYKAD